MTTSLGYPRRLRLKSKPDIDRVFRSGRYYRLGLLQTKALATEGAGPRFMVSVGKSVGSAPERNRLKRVVRAAIRLNRAQLRGSYDVCVFLTRRPTQPVRLATVEPEIRALFQHLSAAFTQMCLSNMPTEHAQDG